MPFGRYTYGVQRHIILDGVPDPKGEGGIWGLNPRAKTCSCLLMIHQAAASISDFAFYRTTSVLVIVRFSVVVDGDAFDLRRPVEFRSGAVHLIVIQTVLATSNKVASTPY